jgi:hypothetical protein
MAWRSSSRGVHATALEAACGPWPAGLPASTRLWPVVCCADVPYLSAHVSRCPVVGCSDQNTTLTPDLPLFRPDISPVGTDRARVMRCRRSLVLAAGCCCCCHRCCQPGQDALPGCPRSSPGDRPHRGGDGPYPGQARCLALGFWPECFRRLDVKGGQRSFPEETRSALDIEGKHVTIQGPSPDLTSSVSVLAKRD